MLGGEQGFAEVAGDDVFGVADGGEVDARIPVDEYIDVCRYISQLRFAQGIREERLEQFGDAVGRHFFLRTDCRWLRKIRERLGVIGFSPPALPTSPVPDDSGG